MGNGVGVGVGVGFESGRMEEAKGGKKIDFGSKKKFFSPLRFQWGLGYVRVFFFVSGLKDNLIS